ncbi:hypothetical protein IGI04_031047 [Brassica rapa subsp. trilocularis]|uniref:Uncharacterized protein n=1 Tax=Brassica rapa subsp. trilocularis TaxID=1813537 RepID=A0ABQ7LSH1_BRACM|nr:hypothetical protein IGI04_031047 [Brassica rapa subsp. trilocularis]
MTSAFYRYQLQIRRTYISYEWLLDLLLLRVIGSLAWAHLHIHNYGIREQYCRLVQHHQNIKAY